MAFLDKGDSIGAYRVQSLIKSKVYTETYRVESEQGVVCFLKLFVLNRVPQHLVDLQTKRVREIEFAQQLSHKNIVSCIESGEIEIGGATCQYYVTNYFNGVLLADKIGQEGKLQEDVAVKIFRGILEALKYLHSRVPVLCHNDLDPTNIILNSVNNDEAELIDLGHISERAYGTTCFDTSDIDPLYHANETRVSIFDEQSDIFSACATLYAMLTGSAPWNIELPQEGTYREKFAPLHQYRKSNKLDFAAVEASDKIRYILKRGLELKNTERYANVDEILSDLDSSDVVEKNDSSGGSSASHKSQPQQSSISSQSPNRVEFHIQKGEGNGFADIAGMAELKSLLQQKVIFVLKDREIAEQYRIFPPNGMLLYGPPGCGKTFFAEKFAEETGFNYLLIKASDLASSFVHGSQEKIRQLFDQAAQNAPIVVCFDEFDAFVPDRSWNNVASEEVNEFLSQMNNCSKRGIFIVATSNRPDKIDPAVLRTGRLDKLIYVPLPDFEARKEMFAIHLRNRPLEEDIDYEELARLTEGYIASDIAYIVNDSATIAAYSRKKISRELLLTSVGNTRPSVCADSLKQYEKIKEKMESTDRRNVNDRSVVSPL